MIERHTPPAFEIKRASITSTGEFSGYVTTWGGAPDTYGDVVRRGAFTRALQRHRAADTQPALLWSHNMAEPVGRWLTFREDERGLLGHGRITVGTKRGAEALELMRDGAIALSVGFVLAEDGARIRADGVREIVEVERLIEVSLVSVPANSAARIIEVKRPETPRDLERLLRDAGLSSRRSKAICAGGWRGAARDERDPLDLVLSRIEDLQRSIEDLRNER